MSWRSLQRQTVDIDVATDLLDDWIAAWSTNDAEVIVAVFTEDGTDIEPGGDTPTGTPALSDYIGTYMYCVSKVERTGELTETGTGVFASPLPGRRR